RRVDLLRAAPERRQHKAQAQHVAEHLHWIPLSRRGRQPAGRLPLSRILAEALSATLYNEVPSSSAWRRPAIPMSSHATRTEPATFGPIDVPADRLWGAQTQRSLQHFRISTERMPAELIRALLIVKRSAARVNIALGTIDKARAEAIIAAADE